MTPIQLWQFEECDVRIKSREARAIQPEVSGAKCECLSKVVVRMEHDRIDDGAEDKCNEEVLYDCFFWECPGASLMRRQTECEVRRHSCVIVSFKSVRRRVVQTRSRVMCDCCRRSVSAVEDCLFSDSGQSYFKREHFICAGCLMMVGIERWESHERNKPGQLQTDYRAYKKRTAERVETAAGVQRVMVETGDYDGDCAYVCGHEVSADVQRRKKHSCIGDGMRIEGRFGCVCELITRVTTPPLSPIAESSVEQHGYVGTRNAHGKEHGFNTLVESGRLVPVKSVLCLEQNGTSVVFTCSGDHEPSRQPRLLLKPLTQSSGVSLLTDQTRIGTFGVQANWRVTVEGKSSVNRLTEVLPSQNTTDVAEPATDSTKIDKTAKEPCPLNRDSYYEQSNRIKVCMKRPLMTYIGVDKIQIWRMHHLTETILQQ